MARILIADDDDDMVEICSRLLPRKGHELLVARNAADAVKLAGEKPDLILMDMRMPMAPDGEVNDRAGLEAVKRIKADPALAGIPVIALTGHTMHKWKEAIFEAGCAELLDKPIVDFALLLGAIARNTGAKPT